jgi:hypothetical protein
MEVIMAASNSTACLRASQPSISRVSAQRSPHPLARAAKADGCFTLLNALERLFILSQRVLDSLFADALHEISIKRR